MIVLPVDKPIPSAHPFLVSWSTWHSADCAKLQGGRGAPVQVGHRAHHAGDWGSGDHCKDHQATQHLNHATAQPELAGNGGATTMQTEAPRAGEWGESLPITKMVVGAVLTLSLWKALPCLSGIKLGLGQGEGKHMQHRSQNCVWEVLDQGPVSLAWRKKELVGR